MTKSGAKRRNCVNESAVIHELLAAQLSSLNAAEMASTTACRSLSERIIIVEEYDEHAKEVGQAVCYHAADPWAVKLVLGQLSQLSLLRAHYTSTMMTNVCELCAIKLSAIKLAGFIL